MISLLLLLSSTFACIDMTGTYKCVTQDGAQMTVDVATKQANGVYIYEVNSRELVADGVVHPLDTGTADLGATYTLTCDAQTVTYFEVYTFDLGGLVRNETTNIYHYDAQENLVQDITYRTTVPDGSIVEEQEQTICSRQ